MAVTKRSIALDSDLVEAALHLAGPRGFSRLVNDALRSYLQLRAVEALEAELARQYGPIPPEIQAEVDAFEWPQ
jgi:Arc/MetJ family transcription regulator